MGVTLNLRLDDQVNERITELAKRYGIQKSQLVRMWIGQRLYEEDQRRGKQQSATTDVNMPRA